MKILHVETGMKLYGGPMQVLWLMKGLEARGHSNVLVCPSGSRIAEDAQRIPVEVHAVGMKGDADIPFIFRLKKIIETERPDVVHLHSRRGADVLGGIACRLAGVKCVLSRRVDNPESRALSFFKYRLFDKVIAISEGIKKVLVSEGVPSRQVVCVRSAVDASTYTTECEREWFQGEFGLGPEHIAFGVVAQLIKRKGHAILFEAIPDFVSDFPNARFIIFGKGALEDELKAAVKAKGLDETVIFSGFRDDLPRILPCLYAVVHPALMEGLGVSLMQAAACGVPVIASAVGGIPEVVRDGINGITVPSGDSAALASAMRLLAGDQSKARSMGEAGRGLAMEEFSVDAMVDGNLSVYTALS